jgi:hypothetical protein
LFELWILADSFDQARISAAVNELELRLSIDPLNVGESRSGELRVEFETPLGISYLVFLDQTVVEIGHVWLCE